jgi:hypothetical protein
MKPALALALAASSLGLLAGCGSMGTGGDVAPEPTPGGSAATGGATDLVVVVSTAPGKGTRTFRLRCDPPGGNHPDPEAACRALTRMDDPFAPVPPDVACTEIYGGTQTATVSGTFRADPVDARFSRADGCQIGRWDRHLALLVEPGGVEVD